MSTTACCRARLAIGQYPYEPTLDYAGVHPDSSTNGELVFAVWCHEAQEKLLAKGETTRDKEALHFVVKLPENCKTISLVSAGVPGEKSAIWMNPKLKSRVHE